MDASVINSLTILIALAVGVTAYSVGRVAGKREQEPRITALRARVRLVTKQRDELQYRLNGYGNVTHLRGPGVTRYSLYGYTPGGDDAA